MSDAGVYTYSSHIENHWPVENRPADCPHCQQEDAAVRKIFADLEASEQADRDAARTAAGVGGMLLVAVAASLLFLAAVYLWTF